MLKTVPFYVINNDWCRLQFDTESSELRWKVKHCSNMNLPFSQINININWHQLAAVHSESVTSFSQ